MLRAASVTAAGANAAVSRRVWRVGCKLTKFLPCLLCAVTFCLAGPRGVLAKDGFTLKDAQVLGRTIGYVGDGATGVVVVGVVYAAADDASRSEAEHIRSVIGTDLTTGRVRLQARLVPTDQLGGVTAVNALYVTTGLEKDPSALFAAAARLHVPTIAADLACVQSGNCVVGFSTEPTVQILINQGAAERIGVHFLQAFRMLVREQ